MARARDQANDDADGEAKRLFDIGKQIYKAEQSGESADVLLALLAPLEKVKATEELLRASKIGITVTKLRTPGKDARVVDVATRLINRWKAEVSKKRRVTGGSSPAPGGAATANNKALNPNGRSTTGSPAPPAAAAAAATSTPKTETKKFGGDPEKRNTAADGVDYSVTGDKVRDGCVKLMYNGLAYQSEEAAGAVLDVARRVEAAAFQHFQQDTSTAYKEKMRSLFQNLKMKGNTKLRQDVFSGVISPDRFASMTSDELKSAEKRREDDQIEKENMNKSRAPEEVKAISTTMTCGRCKQSKVSYSQAQTRSADEPLTTFCECTLCGHRWKFS